MYSYGNTEINSCCCCCYKSISRITTKINKNINIKFFAGKIRKPLDFKHCKEVSFGSQNDAVEYISTLLEVDAALPENTFYVLKYNIFV